MSEKTIPFEDLVVKYRIYFKKRYDFYNKNLPLKLYMLKKINRIPPKEIGARHHAFF